MALRKTCTCEHGVSDWSKTPCEICKRKRYIDTTALDKALADFYKSMSIRDRIMLGDIRAEWKRAESECNYFRKKYYECRAMHLEAEFIKPAWQRAIDYLKNL